VGKKEKRDRLEKEKASGKHREAKNVKPHVREAVNIFLAS
jgi:hypothetical protein